MDKKDTEMQFSYRQYLDYRDPKMKKTLDSKIQEMKSMKSVIAKKMAEQAIAIMESGEADIVIDKTLVLAVSPELTQYIHK